MNANAAVKTRFSIPQARHGKLTADDASNLSAWESALDTYALAPADVGSADLWRELAGLGCPVRAFSIRQPWIRLLTEKHLDTEAPMKTIEFRTVKTPHTGGFLPVALHSSKAPDAKWRALIARYDLPWIARPYGVKPGGLQDLREKAKLPVLGLGETPAPDPGDLGVIVGVGLVGPAHRLDGTPADRGEPRDADRLIAHPGYPVNYAPSPRGPIAYGWPIRAVLKLDSPLHYEGALGFWDLDKQGGDDVGRAMLCARILQGDFEVIA